MEEIKDEQSSDSSFTLSDFESESDKEESFQEEQYPIESFEDNWEELNEGISDNRNENSLINLSNYIITNNSYLTFFRSWMRFLINLLHRLICNMGINLRCVNAIMT